MSNSNPNFVSELVQMARAFEELPTVKAELEQTKHESNAFMNMVQDRELSIIGLKAEIDTLHAKVREMEAARDDAEYRFLESEDRVKSALNFIKGTFGSAGSLIQALEPPAPVVPEQPPTPEVKVGASEVSPTLPNASDRQTFVVPDGHEAVLDADGRATGETQPIPTPPAEPEQRYDAPQGGVNYATDAPMQGQSEPLPPDATTLPASVTTTPVPSSAPTDTSALEGVAAAPVDPTAPQATEQPPAVGTQPAETVVSASSPSDDDVGYHNEPPIDDWQSWNAWRTRMTSRYGNQWPIRSHTS